MKLSVVIPARNEEGNVGTTVAPCAIISTASISAISKSWWSMTAAATRPTRSSWRSTNRIARIRVVRNTGRNGFGRAVACGLDHFTGDAVIITMADASDSPEDVAKYYAILRDEADCAFGSRFMRGSKIYDYPKFKLIDQPHAPISPFA